MKQSTAPKRDMIFVSHANPEDNEFARWLTLQLANEGYPVWCDQTKLLGGEKFWENIEDAIKIHTIKFLFILTRLLADRDERMELRKQELRKKIAQGLDSLQRGEGVDGDEFFAQLEGEEASLEKSPAE
jgi:hypothetical protein